MKYFERDLFGSVLLSLATAGVFGLIGGARGQTPVPAPATHPAGGSMDTPVGPIAPMRELVLDAKYAARSAAILKQPAPAPDEPFCGCQIISLVPGSQAVGLELKAGDVITVVGDVAVTGVRTFSQAWDNAAGDTTVTLWSPETKSLRNVVIAAGRIGIGDDDYWRPDVQYLRGIPAGQKPDDNLLVAARVCQTQDDLAETALFRARSDSPFATLLGAAAAYYDCRFDDALPLALKAMKELPPEDRKFAAVIAYRSALTTFRLPLAKKIADQHGEVLQANDIDEAFDSLARQIGDYSGPDSQLGTSPADLFGSLKPQDVTSKIVSLETSDYEKRNSEWGADHLSHSRPINFTQAIDTYASFLIGPADVNIDFTARARFTPTGGTDRRFENMFVPEVKSGDSNQTVAQMNMMWELGTKKILFKGPDMPTCRVDVGQLIDGGKTFIVRCTAAGGQVEYRINGRPIYRGILPVPQEDRSLRIRAEVLALTGTIDKAKLQTAPAGP